VELEYLEYLEIFEGIEGNQVKKNTDSKRVGK